jgi:Uma2 family endonuclease
MSLTSPPPFSTGAGFGPPPKRWTTDEYHALIEHGIIGDGAPLELIDGVLIHKDRGEGGISMTYGPRHALAIGQLAELNGLLKAHGFHIRNQLPLTIAPHHEPEPDGAVIRGVPVDYRHANPTDSDSCLVIEVADSSLSFDRTTKQRIYATAGIPAYWIVNLRNDTIEVHEQPDLKAGEYRVRRDFQKGQALDLVMPSGASLAIDVGSILG